MSRVDLHNKLAPEIVRLPIPHVYRTPKGMTEDEYVDFGIRQLEHALIAQVDPSAVAAMLKSGCENVWPTLRPYSKSSRHLTRMSSVMGKTRPRNIGRKVSVSQSLNSARRTESAFKLDTETDFREAYEAFVEKRQPIFNRRQNSGDRSQKTE